MPRHLADHLAEGRHIPGIFVIDPFSKIGEILTELIIIAGASFAKEYQDRIEYLPLSQSKDFSSAIILPAKRDPTQARVLPLYIG